MAKAYANRVWMTTATAGTGTITLGSAKAGYLTFAEGNVSNADTVTYVLTDGNDFEIGTGTYTSSGTTMSRDTVTVSKIGGTAGTTKLTLSGSAEVFISPAQADTAFLDRANTFSETQTLKSTDAGATAGPIVDLFRDSASPAASDVIGSINFSGRDSAANAQDYAYIRGVITDATSATEDADLVVSTAAAGAVAERFRIGTDGVARTRTNASANLGTVLSQHWIYQVADRSLSNVGTEQKIFNQTTNGALTLPTGVYQYECLYYITDMSATSGNASFDPIGGGTATSDQFGFVTWGLDSTTPTNAGAIGGAVTVTQQTGTNAVVAAVGTGVWVMAKGMFRVTAAGTIIPSITLKTAAAATLKGGSWFNCSKIGETTETSVGNWS